MLTRKQMEDLVNSGQGVLYQGTIITNIEGLPDEVELVGGNPEEQARLADELAAQIARLQDQYRTLNNAVGPTAAPTEAKSAAPPQPTTAQAGEAGAPKESSDSGAAKNKTAAK